MVRDNKAHTTTVNRIVRRYSGKLGLELEFDVKTSKGIVAVETEATISRGIRQLKRFHGPAYLAVTNKEALPEALRATDGSGIGVMDPQGNIVKQAIRPARTNGHRPRNGQRAAKTNGTSLAES